VNQQLEIPALANPDVKAKVAGKAVHQWPDDLYIPPQALEVFLETFEGPLDLLLYLIRRHNLDILDIPVAEITQQYMDYVELMKSLQLDLAAEYLVMAAMLAEIKSRMLLPGPVASEEADEEDPRLALVLRLQQYERIRQAAAQMDERPRLGRNVFVLTVPVQDSNPPRRLPQVLLSQLRDAARNVLMNSVHQQSFRVGIEVLSVRERMTRILRQLQNRGFLRLEQLFEPAEGRVGLVVSFVAVLELVRDQTVDVVQESDFSSIHVQSRGAG